MAGTRMKTLLCLAICFHCSHSSLTGYDCSSTSILEYDVLSSDLLPSCQTIRESDKYWVQIIELPAQPTVGYQCMITFNETLVDVNGFSRVVANGSEMITREDCLEAHKTNYLAFSGNRIFVNTNGTVSHEVSVGDHYDFLPGMPRNRTRKYRYIKTYDITLSKPVATVDLEYNIIRFDNNIVCDYDNYTCHEDQFGMLAWNPIETDERYSTIYSGVINFATVSESFLSGREFKYAVIKSTVLHKVFLLLTYDVLNINGHRAFRTELPNVYILFSDYGNYSRGWEYDGRLKNVYSVPFHSEYIDIVDIGKRRCITENHGLNIRLKSLPTFSRVLLDRKGTMGIKINKRTGSFSVQKCEITEVHVRETQACYREIPVRVGLSRERFLNPVSRALLDHGTPVSCEQMRYNVSENIMWFEHSPEYVEPTVDMAAEKNSTVGTTTGELKTTIETASEKSKAPQVRRASFDTARPDWIKVLGLVSLCLWIFVAIARLFKLVICCVPKIYHRKKTTNAKPATSSAMAVLFKQSSADIVLNQNIK